jgi:hypothetical protein
MKKNQIYLLLSIAVLAAMSIVLFSLNYTKSEKVVINTPKIKELIKKNPTIVFNENKLLFVSSDSNYKEHFDTLNLKVNNQFKDVLFIDTTGYLYVTNDLRLKENVFTPKCKTGLADADGNLLLKPIYDRIYVFDQTIKDLVIIKNDNKLGLANKDGIIVAQTIYQNIYPDFTNSGYKAILANENTFYSLENNNSLKKINSNNSYFQNSFKDFSYLNNLKTEDLNGNTLFGVQNKKYHLFNFERDNSKNYYYYDSLDTEFQLRDYQIVEPQFAIILDSLYFNTNEKFTQVEAEYLSVDSFISEVYNVSKNVWAFVLSLHQAGDRGFDHNNSTLVTLDQNLKTIDTLTLEKSYNHESEYLKLNDYIYLKIDYLYNKNKLVKQIIYLDTNEKIISSNFYQRSNENIEIYGETFEAYDIKKYYKINSNGKISELSFKDYSRKRYLFTKFTKLTETLINQVEFYEEYGESQEFLTRQMNSQELQEMLDEIINDYKDKNGKVPNNVESKMTEIDQYNVKFIRNKMNQLSANIKK